MDNDLKAICDLLGVPYDLDHFNTLNVCDRIAYLIDCIYSYLSGGSNA